jgi:hypothetical protein
VVKTVGKILLGRLRLKGVDNNKINLRERQTERRWGDVDWINLAHKRGK